MPPWHTSLPGALPLADEDSLSLILITPLWKIWIYGRFGNVWIAMLTFHKGVKEVGIVPILFTTIWKIGTRRPLRGPLCDDN